MSTEEDKFKKSKRILNDENTIRKQIKIAKQHKVSEYNPSAIDQPHRFAKQHAMNCGNPNCVMCANPRKVWKEKTIQEKRFEQTEKFDND